MLELLNLKPCGVEVNRHTVMQTTYVLFNGVLVTLTFNNMIEKIINGTYKAKLLKKRLCDVKIIVWGNGEPKTIEQVSYNEYNIIEPYLVKEGE